MVLWIGFEHYFTGPLEHDILFELLFGAAALFILFAIWKLGKFNWPGGNV